MHLPYSPTAIYHLAKLLFPNGSMGGECLPIIVEDNLMQLRIGSEPDTETYIELYLHYADARFARWSAVVDLDGEAYNSMLSAVPGEDLLADEEPISLNDDTLMEMVYATLLSHLKSRLLENTAVA